MKHRTRVTALSILAAAGLAALAAPASAQDAPRPERRAQGDRPMLSGPRVREQRVPGTESGFSAGAEGGARMGATMVPPQVFRGAIAALMAEDAPLEIRLSPEQRERIAAHVRAFEDRMRAERPAGPAQQGGPRTGPSRPTDRADARPDARREPAAANQDQRARGDRPRPQEPRAPQGQEPRGDRRPAARQNADGPQAMQDQRPQRDAGPARTERPADRGNARQAVTDVQTRIWAELSAAQQAHVAKAIESWRGEQDSQQRDQMRERYRREIGARFEQMEGDRARPTDRPTDRARDGAQPGGGASDVRQWVSTLPEDVQRRVKERLQSMPAERREAVLQRIGEMSPEDRGRLVERLLRSNQDENSPSRPR